MIKPNSLESVIALLTARVATSGNQREAAKALGVSHALIGRVLRNEMAPPPKLLAALGLRREVRYVEDRS